MIAPEVGLDMNLNAIAVVGAVVVALALLGVLMFGAAIGEAVVLRFRRYRTGAGPTSRQYGRGGPVGGLNRLPGRRS